MEALLENRGENAYSTVLNISFSRNLQFASLIPKVRCWELWWLGEGCPMPCVFSSLVFVASSAPHFGNTAVFFSSGMVIKWLLCSWAPGCHGSEISRLLTEAWGLLEAWSFPESWRCSGSRDPILELS